jgi:L-lactate dehydrogenase complex protein LldG
MRVHAIASYLSSNNLPPRLRIGADLRLAALPWKAAWDISRVYGRAEPSDKACLSRAIVAAAETGTLFLVSGADNPTTLNFLPEFHMVLVKARISSARTRRLGIACARSTANERCRAPST